MELQSFRCVRDMQYKSYLEKAEIIIETAQMMLISDLETLLYFFFKSDDSSKNSIRLKVEGTLC